MSKLKLILIWAKLVVYSIKMLLKPKDIFTLLKLGNLLTDTQSFRLFVQNVKSSPEASVLINSRYSLLPLNENWQALYPENSLGWAYHQHLNKNGLQTYPFQISKDCSEAVYLRERQREIHDILHAAFGLGIDIADEAQLNSILIAQGAAPISVLIVAGSMIHTVFKTPDQTLKIANAIVTGYSYGKRIRSVYSLEWEELLGLPLKDVRGLIENAPEPTI